MFRSEEAKAHLTLLQQPYFEEQPELVAENKLNPAELLLPEEALNPKDTLIVHCHTQKVKGGQDTAVAEEAKMQQRAKAHVMAYTVHPMEPEKWGTFPTYEIDYIPGEEGHYEKEAQYRHFVHAGEEAMLPLLHEIQRTGARNVIFRGHHADGGLLAFRLHHKLQQFNETYGLGVDSLPVVTVHSLYREKEDGTDSDAMERYNAQGGTTRARVEARLYRKLLMNEGVVTTASPLQLKYFQEFGVPPEMVPVMPPGINQEVFTYEGDEDADWAIAEKYGIERGQRFIYVPARMSPQKGHLEDIAAFGRLAAKYPDVKLLFTGGDNTPKDEEYRSQLRAAAEAAGIADRLILSNFVKQDELAALARRSSFVMLASKYEHFGLSLAETMNCGALAIAGKNMGSTMSAVEFGRQREQETLIAVDPYDIDELAAAMDRVLGNPQLQRQIAANGRAWANTLTWENSVSQLLTIAGRQMKANQLRRERAFMANDIAAD